MLKNAGLLLVILCLALGACSGPPEVTVATGTLRGVEADGVMAFKGIPFAAPPVGEWRWRPPQPPATWTGVRDAGSYGSFCAQPQSEFLWFELTEVSEDCLTLNVWTPDIEPDQALPVMVWIHGGGYSQGSGNIARLNSPAFARQGVVLVTLNYRLHAFGFMVHPDIRAAHPKETHGNYGLMDNVAALEWVRDNIAQFGGDPEQVTIFGESAGAGLVNFLMVMPSAEGLFHRAISQSSSVGMAPEMHIDQRRGFLQSGEATASRFARKLPLDESVDTATALRALSMEEILGAMNERDRFVPVVDGELVPDQVAVMLALGKQHKVPYITGGVSWEASLGRQIGGGFSPEFSLRLVSDEDKARLYPGLSGNALADAIFGDLIVHGGGRNVATQLSQAGQPVYSYYMSYVASDRRSRQPGVAHADDIAFVLQSLESESDLQNISERDREISALMSRYWLEFAKTGNPNAAGLPEWPVFEPDTAEVLEIGDEIEVREGFMRERMQFHMARGLSLLGRSRL